MSFARKKYFYKLLIHKMNLNTVFNYLQKWPDTVDPGTVDYFASLVIREKSIRVDIF